MKYPFILWRFCLKGKIYFVNLVDKLLLGLSVLFSLISTGISWMLFKGSGLWFMSLGFAASLLLSLVIFRQGLQVLWEKYFVLLSCLYPLGLNLGLVAIFFQEKRTLFSAFAFFGLLFVLMAHSYSKDWGSFAVALVHAGAGMSIFIIPVVAVGRGVAPHGFLWFSAGAVAMALMGSGLLYYFSVPEERRKPVFLKGVPLGLFLGSFFFSLGLYGLLK